MELREGMERAIPLIIAKAILTQRAACTPAEEIIRQAARFGLQQRDGWGAGMTVLAAMANLAPRVSAETGFLLLFEGARRVASDAAGQTPRRPRRGLEGGDHGLETLGAWLRHWTTVRHRDGAERTLRTAIEQGRAPAELEGLVMGAETERFYAETDHPLDFANKAFELLAHIGPEHAEDALPALVPQLVAARGGEELNTWRHPVDLVPPIRDLSERLPELFAHAAGEPWNGETALAEQLLGDDPHAILDPIRDAITTGARPPQLGAALAYAAAERVARFGTANEHRDWIAALHSFSYCNALHQSLRRRPEPDALAARGLLHGAMSVYLNRFLNVPPAKLPYERGGLDELPREAEALRARFLDALDRPQRVDEAAAVVERYLELGHPTDALIDTLAYAAVREDADFHSLQMLEAAVLQHEAWGGAQPGRIALIALARYLAAHSPTPRAQLQTAEIALRLHRGEVLHEEA